jgi:aminoglycoside phosphotransferase (APT) family kinase protein
MDRPLVNKCIETTNWDALREYASARNNGIKCKVHPKITNGVNHLVCLLEFENNARWVARIQMRESTLRLATRRQNEVNVMKILRERTKVPVPQVFGYEIDSNNPTGGAFVLMEFFPGNSAMDASGGYEVHRGILPLQHRESFFDALAPVQVSLLLSLLISAIQ